MWATSVLTAAEMMMTTKPRAAKATTPAAVVKYCARLTPPRTFGSSTRSSMAANMTAAKALEPTRMTPKEPSSMLDPTVSMACRTAIM